MILNTATKSIACAHRGMAVRNDSSELLHSIDIPTLIVCGSGDRITPIGEMQSMSLKIRNATFLEIPESGHLSPLENPKAFNQGLQAWIDSSF